MIRSLGPYTIVKTSLEKSGRKKNRTRFFLSFSWKIPKQRNIWKGSSIFPDGMFQTEIRFNYHLLKPIFYTSVRLPQAFLGKRNWFMQVLLTILEWSLTVLNFSNDLPKLWTNWFAHANGKKKKKTHTHIRFSFFLLIGPAQPSS